MKCSEDYYVYWVYITIEKQGLKTKYSWMSYRTHMNLKKRKCVLAVIKKSGFNYKIKRRYITMKLRCRKATQYGNPLTLLTDDGTVQLNEGCVNFEAEFKNFMYNPIDNSLVVVCNGKCTKHTDGMKIGRAHV